MTKRQAIANAVITQLNTIKIANGYKTDFPAVKHWSVEILDKADQVYCNVRDTKTDYDNSTPFSETLTIDVALGCTKKSNNYSFITNMIDDVYKCMYNAERTLQTQFGDVQIIPVGDELDIQQFEYQVAEAVVTFQIIHSKHARWFYDERSF